MVIEIYKFFYKLNGAEQMKEVTAENPEAAMRAFRTEFPEEEILINSVTREKRELDNAEA